MKVMVTGSAGLIGSVLVPYLKEKGHEVRPFDVRGGENCGNEKHLQNAMEGQEAVIHMAAISWPDPSKTAEQFLEQNVVNAARVARVANEMGVKKFVFTSSTTVYGFEDGMSTVTRKEMHAGMRTYLNELEWSGDGYVVMRELPALMSKLHYITAKIAAEALVAQYGLAGNMRVLIMRLAPVRNPEVPYLGLAVDGMTLSVAMEKALVGTGNDPGVQWFDMVEPRFIGVGKPVLSSATEPDVMEQYLQ